MTNKLLEQDLRRLLTLLQERGPKTANELHRNLGLSLSRVLSLLRQLQQDGLVHSPHCTTGTKGNPVNLWEAKPH